MNEKNQLFKKGERAAVISAAVLLAFSILKGTVSVISGSVALLADSIHSFADIFSSIAVWAGLKLVQKKPTERFPYGYYKAETLALLIVAVTIVVSGVLILKEAVDKLFEPSVVLFPSVVLAVAAFSGLVSYFLGRYKKSVGSLIGSQSLVSEGQHYLVDVYTSLMVFVGVLFASLGYPVAEVLAGLAIGLYVMKVGLWFGRDAVLVLMDACLSPQKANEMKEIAEKVRGVGGVHDLRLHKSGPVSFGEMHIEVQEDVPVEKAHELSDEIEEKIRQRFKDIESIMIHVEPAPKERIKVGAKIEDEMPRLFCCFYNFETEELLLSQDDLVLTVNGDVRLIEEVLGSLREDELSDYKEKLQKALQSPIARLPKWVGSSTELQPQMRTSWDSSTRRTYLHHLLLFAETKCAGNRST